MKTETTLIGIKTVSIYQNVIIGLSFFIPFLISGPQLLTGSLVNLFLILGTRFIEKRNHWLIAVLPSIAAVLNGFVFGKFTPFLVYFLPFIWLGNFVLIKSILYFKSKFVYAISIILGIVFKTIILFTIALIFFKTNLVPEIFLTAMGIFQLVTGMIGGFIFLGMNNFVRIKNYDRR